MTPPQKKIKEKRNEISDNFLQDTSCGQSASSGLLSVCVKRKMPSDENLYELSRRPQSEYAPFPRWRTPHPHYFIPHSHCLYAPYRDQMYFLRHPYHYDWFSEEEEHARMVSTWGDGLPRI